MINKLTHACMRFMRVGNIACQTTKRQLSTTAARHCSHEDKPQRIPTSQADSFLDIGSRDLFDASHDIFRASARKFFSEEVKPYHAQWEEDGQVSREVWEKAGAAGLLGIGTPAEAGGHGADFLHSAIAVEEQCYARASGPGFSLHSNVVMPYFTNYGTKEQIERYVPDMTAGKKISAIAMTEPGAGSDLQGVKTRAVRDGDDWILNGSKTYITNGTLCDVVLVVAVTDPDARARAHGISLFIVDAGTKGFNKGRKLKKLGLKAQDTSELFFEDVRLPKEALLGTELNKGFYQLMQELPQERLMVGLGCTAACEVMYEDTRAFIKERKAFGKSLAKMQVIQHKLAELKTSICVARAFTDQCIGLHTQGRLDAFTAAMNKYWASDLANKVAYDCLQLHGGSGYMLEYPISRSYADMSHCLDHRGLGHCQDHRGLGHCQDHRGLRHCLDHRGLGHCLDHRGLGPCQDHRGLGH
ncbi:long-chain specific acyl-CoA dehydrogenase, mitochondrial [Hyalella azteca]|uniref:Long-chain specific acyl-CoA dehydrogenase, mitochondrial n=1 Tax=Hyalella azteca TaxID=294128 RepID=A0A8B7PG15_HYAAZ|nr:long-chain specific acyl-CoA dehydrogenase, mitochondrial [Hyalella azteca]